MEEFVAKLNEYLVLAEQAVQSVAPDVWDATLIVLRAEGIMQLISALLWLIPAAVYLFYMRRLWAWGIKNADYSDATSLAACVLLTIIVGIITLLTVSNHVLDAGMWLSIFAPEIAVVYRIAEQVSLL